MLSIRPAFAVAFAMVVCLLLSACSDDGSSGQTLKVEIGVVQSQSGAAAIYGKSVLQGIELAVEEINDSEERVDMSVTLIDDGSSVDMGKAAFDTLAGRNVTAIIGPTLSNVALEAMPVAQAASIPVLGATTTAQGINEIGDYVFRVALTEAVVVPATIARVHEDLPIAQPALIFDSSDAFSRSSADAMRAGVSAIGGTIAAEIDVATTDLASQFADLHAKPIDTFLVTPLVEKSLEIVKALRGDGFQQPIVGGNSFNTPSIAQSSGAAVEGAYVGAAWNPGVDSTASRRFIDAYTEKYGAAPDLFAAQGYSSVYILLDAVKRAGSVDRVVDRAVVRDALASTTGVETPLGSVTFSEGREAQHAPVVQRFEAGNLVVLP